MPKIVNPPTSKYISTIFIDELFCQKYIDENWAYEEDTVIRINPDWTLEDVVIKLGYFPS